MGEKVAEFGRRWDAFPLPVEHRADQPFLDKAAVVGRDPDHADDFGRQNVGTHRPQVLGGRRLTVIPVAVRELGRHIATAEAGGEDLPSGALRGSPAPVTAAPATGLDVPWGSEVVIDGVVEARRRVHEGPLGEFTGNYSGGRKAPVVRVDRISHRTMPYPGHPAVPAAVVTPCFPWRRPRPPTPQSIHANQARKDSP